MTARRDLYRYVFFITIAIYCLLVGRFGFENWDSGFLSGFSWRIINGETIYKDFLYIRPPVSAYFHAFFMELLPEQGQFFFFRITGYLLFALQVWLTVSGFDSLFHLNSINLNKWALMTVGFILSIHNFFGNPWFTTDGILFASAAFYLIARFRKPGLGVLFSTALFCLLSALTKQSFYFVPVLFTIWIFLDSGIKKCLWFLFFLTVTAAVFLGLLFRLGTIGTMLAQISGNATLADLYEVGFNSYIHCYHNKYIFIAVFALPGLLSWYEAGKRIPSPALYLKWLALIVFCTALIALFLLPFKKATTLFFNAALVAFAYKSLFDFNKTRYYFPVAVLLGIAWCVSLSLGYRYPVLYTTAIVLSYIFLMHDDLKAYKTDRFLPLLAIAACLYVFSLNAKPYRQENIRALSYSLENVSPKLKYILTDKKTVSKYLDLKKLVQQYGPDYITVPSIPMSHYLFDQKNPFPTEWTTNFEINNKTTDLLRLAASKKMYIFVEKSFIEGEPYIVTPENRNEFSLFTVYIYKHCRPKAETDDFIIYDSGEIGKHLPSN